MQNEMRESIANEFNPNRSLILSQGQDSSFGDLLSSIEPIKLENKLVFADFDHHGKFIKELIKMPAFWKSLYQILSPG